MEYTFKYVGHNLATNMIRIQEKKEKEQKTVQTKTHLI